ncbi:MAG: 7TM diverse intracellular signaling domain-containing protein, partial [Bacteroidota bacterium]
MMVYNFMLYLSLKQRTYLYYTLTILGSLVLQASLSGHTIKWFWGNSVYWSNTVIVASMCLAFLFALLFSADLLGLKARNRRLYRALIVLASVCLCSGVAGFFIDYTKAVRISVILVFFVAIFLFSTGIWSWIRGNIYARFFTIAWTVYIVGAIIFAIRTFGFPLEGFWVEQGMRVGSVLEVTLLSFALADRINMYRREKEEAQSLALEKSKENEQVLEGRVKERTEELQAQRDELEVKNRVLDEKDRQVSSSLRDAKLIQKAVLSDKSASVFSEYFIVNRPRDVVSGDFHLIESISTEETIWIVADCTGHGVSGAFMTLIGHSFLKQIIQIEKIKNPAAILERLHELVDASLKQDGIKNDSGMDAAVVHLKKVDHRFEVTFAGAKSPLYYATSNNQSLTTIRGTARSVGLRRRKKRNFENHSIQLPKGSTLYIGSDGMQDQNDPEGKRFG